MRNRGSSVTSRCRLARLPKQETARSNRMGSRFLLLAGPQPAAPPGGWQCHSHAARRAVPSSFPKLVTTGGSWSSRGPRNDRRTLHGASQPYAVRCCLWPSPRSRICRNETALGWRILWFDRRRSGYRRGAPFVRLSRITDQIRDPISLPLSRTGPVDLGFNQSRNTSAVWVSLIPHHLHKIAWASLKLNKGKVCSWRFARANVRY